MLTWQCMNGLFPQQQTGNNFKFTQCFILDYRLYARSTWRWLLITLTSCWRTTCACCPHSSCGKCIWGLVDPQQDADCQKAPLRSPIIYLVSSHLHTLAWTLKCRDSVLPNTVRRPSHLGVSSKGNGHGCCLVDMHRRRKAVVGLIPATAVHAGPCMASENLENTQGYSKNPTILHRIVVCTANRCYVCLLSLSIVP